MSIIRTLSADAALYHSGGLLEPTKANFPALIHLFPCNEPTSTGAGCTIHDVINDLVLTDAAGTGNITNNGDGTITASASIDTISSGTLRSPGTKNVILLWGGKPGSGSGSQLTFGSVIVAGTNFGFKSTAQTSTGSRCCGNGTAVVDVGTTTTLAGTGSQLQTRALAFTWGSATGFAPYDYDGTTCTARSTTLSAGTAFNSVTGITAIDQAVSIGATVVPGFIQIWHFTTMPTANEIQAAAAWTHAMAFTASLGNLKLAYPGWKGRT